MLKNGFEIYIRDYCKNLLGTEVPKYDITIWSTWGSPEICDELWRRGMGLARLLSKDGIICARSPQVQRLLDGSSLSPAQNRPHGTLRYS